MPCYIIEISKMRGSYDMNDDLYLAGDGTIRSRSGRAQPRQPQPGESTRSNSGHSVSRASDRRRVYVSRQVRWPFWLASLILAGLIAYAGCELFAIRLAESSDMLSSTYVSCRYDFGRWIHRAAEHSKSRFDWKVIEPIRRLLFTIHTETRNKKYKKGVSEKGLPDGFHYRIEGLRVRGGALLMMEGYCHKAEHGAYVHIESETGAKFIFDIDMLDPIAGDRHAIPDDDYVQIFLWIHRHEQELSFEWYAYASPIVEWHRWNASR